MLTPNAASVSTTPIQRERGENRSKIALLVPVLCIRSALLGAAIRSYFAVQGRRTYPGGWHTVLTWAGEQTKQDSVPVKIISARPGERNGRIIAEVTREGVRIINHGRQVAIRSINGKKA